MLKKFYEKSEIWFAVAWIIGYVVLASAGDTISADLGILLIFGKTGSKNNLWSVCNEELLLQDPQGHVISGQHKQVTGLRIIQLSAMHLLKMAVYVLVDQLHGADFLCVLCLR